MSDIDAAPRPASRKVVLVLLLILGLYLIFRTTAIQSANQVNQPIPLGFWPDDAAQIMMRNDLTTDQIDWATRDANAIMETVRAANKADPLYPWHFLIAGIAAREAEDLAMSERALIASKKRDPRDFGPRYYLIQHYLMQNQLQAAMEEIIPTARLHQDPRLLQALLVLSQTPEGNKILLDGLKGDPNVRDRLVQIASDSDDHQDLLAVLLASSTLDKALKFQVVSKFAAREKYALARSFWSIADPSAKKDDTIFDNHFDGLSAPTPFGWALTQDSYVAAVFSEGNKPRDINLDVEYFGVREVEAAHQILFLKPGNYKLSATGAAVDPKMGAGDMFWFLTCVGETDLLGRITFTASKPGVQRMATQITVPTGNCKQQRLVLIGDAGLSPSTYRIRFNTINLEPI